MIRTAIAAVALSLGVLTPIGAPAAPMADDSVLTQLLDKATEVYGGKGFSATGWSYQSSLQQGGEETVSVSLTGGGQYQVIGVCDTDCSDLDIHLIDSNGNEVDKDLLKDDFPIVGTGASGTYKLRIVMTACSAGPCGYALKAFRK
jgi:hypothetical protein